jgi:hypothetical protein
MKNQITIPFWEQYTMTIKEASQYFGIGETKLRSIIGEEPTADFILWNGNRALIKRKVFEDYIDKSEAI